MNKLIKLSAAFLLAVVVTACGGEDPKADYKKLLDWNQQQAPVQVQMVNDFQKAMSEAKEPAQVEAAINGYKDNAKKVLDSLEKVEVKSKELKEFKAKSEDVLKQSIDVTAFSAKAAATPLTDEEKAELQAKVEKLQGSIQEIGKLDAELQKKFGDQPEAK